MSRSVVILATLDTKSAEAVYLRERIEALGGAALLVDIGVVGEPGVEPDVGREEIAAAGGTPLAELLEAPTREDRSSPVMIAGAISRSCASGSPAGQAHAVLGIGGTQGTSTRAPR